MEPDKFTPYTQIGVLQFPEGLGGNDIIENAFKGPISNRYAWVHFGYTSF